MSVLPCFASAVVLLALACNPRLSHKPEPVRQEPSLDASNSSVDVPTLRGRVNDYANLLTPAQEAELSAVYEALEQEIGSQIALLTVESLRGIRIEDYSLNVANAWGLGRRGIDDGVLITVAFEDRSVRIEVGIGLESVISDEAAGEVIRHMVPEFAAGDFFSGLKQGSLDIVQMIHANVALVGQRKP